VNSEDPQIALLRERQERLTQKNLSFARSTFPGLIAAAASAGVIVGDGWRSGMPLAPFIRLGAALFSPRIAAFFPNVVHGALGVTLHTALWVLWGICFTAVARSLRGGRLFIAALIVTALLGIFARVAFPLALGAAEVSFMSTAHVILYLATIAVALTIGTRLARYE
jgi:hypothetical protein